VLDVRLPGMSGLEVQYHLNEAGASIPIIFITRHGDIPLTVKAMKSGAVEFLTKPFRDLDLIDAIHHALKKQCRVAPATKRDCAIEGTLREADCAGARGDASHEFWHAHKADRIGFWDQRDYRRGSSRASHAKKWARIPRLN
jgi:DNA-binding response OmpR family regulator